MCRDRLVAQVGGVDSIRKLVDHMDWIRVQNLGPGYCSQGLIYLHEKILVMHGYAGSVKISSSRKPIQLGKIYHMKILYISNSLQIDAKSLLSIRKLDPSLICTSA